MFTYETRPVELDQVVYVHIVLIPETTKRNHLNNRNETTETSKIVSK